MPNNQTPPDSDLAMHRLTRIQFDPDGTGRFRWRVWAGSRLIHDELSRPETIEAILLETRLLCTDSFPWPSA